VGIKQFDELCEISKRPGQPVDLVDQHDLDFARGHVREKIELSFRHPVMMRGATGVSNRQ
jgi:hypothetical protein